MTEALKAVAESLRKHPNTHHYKPKVWASGAQVRVYLSTPLRPLEPSKIYPGRYKTIEASWTRPPKQLGHINVTAEGITWKLGELATPLDIIVIGGIIREVAKSAGVGVSLEARAS